VKAQFATSQAPLSLGTYSCKDFEIYYQGVPYNGFRMASDRECWLPRRAVKRDPTVEYLFPCETTEERQREQEAAAERQIKGFPLLIPSDVAPK
jgi:hypothetical protein